MENKNFISRGLCLLILQFLLYAPGKAQDYSKALAKADTTNFSVAKNNDWQLLNSYIEFNRTKDSVILELIVLNDKKNIDWKNDQYIGKIKPNKFFSKTGRVAFSNLLNDIYKVKIEQGGNCYFNLEKGSPPSVVPAVIPLKVIFKL